MTDETMHQIGEVAERTGLSLRTIRYYEEVDLVRPSGRTSGGFRLYTDDDVERLLLVKHMKPLEFTIEEMRDLLTVSEKLRSSSGGARDELLDRFEMYAAAARERCQALRAQLDTAETLAADLRRRARRYRREASRAT